MRKRPGWSARPKHKIAVIGGGPAGLATALALIADAHDVTVIERSDYSDFRVGEHLPPAGISSLQELRVPDRIFSAGHRSCHGIRASWGESRLADSSYVFDPGGEGVNLSRPSFDAALAEHAHQRGVQIQTNTRVRGLTREADEWHLALSTPDGSSSVRANFLVDASGRAAAIARMLGRKIIVHDKLIGLIGLLSASEALPVDLDESLLLEASEHGWWYVSHLIDGRAVAAYLTDNAGEQAHPLKVWRERLAETTFAKERLRGFRLPARVEVRSARTQQLDRSSGAGWLAVGDAAMAFDPLSSQGIAKGLADGIEAARAIRPHSELHTTTLVNWDVLMKRTFGDYLQSRADYYRMETRWPSSDFWQRRHRLLPGEIAVTLDPMMRLVAPEGVHSEHARGVLEETLTGIDAALVIEQAASPRFAHDLVAQLKTETHGHSSDRALVVAVQTLLARGFLVQN